MYRLDLVLVCAVAFGFGSWRSVWTDVGALLWIITVLAGVHVFLNGGIGILALKLLLFSSRGLCDSARFYKTVSTSLPLARFTVFCTGYYWGTALN